MNMSEHAVISQQTRVMAAAEQACKKIAPTWPLDRMIAVNPLWERRDQSWSAVARHLWQSCGSLLTLNARGYEQAWNAGRIKSRHLRLALQQSQSALSPDDLQQFLQTPLVTGKPIPMPEDMQPVNGHLPPWPDLITHQIGQFCAAWFDREQADWALPRHQGMYATWRAHLLQDHGITVLSGRQAVLQQAAGLPDSHQALLSRAVTQLDIPADNWAQWFDALLQRNLGWASWCAYLNWQAQLQGQQEHSLIELLAIRAAWQLLLDDGQRTPGSVWQRWQQGFHERLEQPPEDLWQALQVWQRADELAWQEQLQQRLAAAADNTVSVAAEARLYFCIDVRSEPMRRAIEQISPAMHTSGFAGFFGLPIEYAPLGEDSARPQLPGLLAPQMRVSESSGDPGQDQVLIHKRHQQQGNKSRWQLFERLPASTFTLVETLGLGYLGKLAARQGQPGRLSSGAKGSTASLMPVIDGLDSAQKTDLVARILKAMSLTENLPPLLVLVGHDSQSANNPQRAGLACGACCGQSGEVNARLLASLLNDREIRQKLAQRGIQFAADSHVLAALHNTTTDEITLFDTELVPTTLREKVQQLRQVLDQAAQQVRAERAPSLGLQALAGQPQALLDSLRKRATDWAETRPEWGLANNAAFIAAPRNYSLGADLQGRVFLHDYDWQQDQDGSVLELIMTAPVVVAHWINLQYLTSTTDNRRFGSGNKVLHNVTGGRIGVFEGNGGDLRTGLAWQSVHNGQHWMHTPLRLTVIIHAPQHMIDAVLDKHLLVRQLVDNQWLYLQCPDPDSAGRLLQRDQQGWQAFMPE